PAVHSSRRAPFTPGGSCPDPRRIRRRGRPKPGTAVPSARGVDSEARLARAHDGLAAVLDRDLVEDVREVIAHGLLGEGQMRRDLGVVATTSEELEDLELAPGQAGEGTAAAGPWNEDVDLLED